MELNINGYDAISSNHYLKDRYSILIQLSIANSLEKLTDLMEKNYGIDRNITEKVNISTQKPIKSISTRKVSKRTTRKRS